MVCIPTGARVIGAIVVWLTYNSNVVYLDISRETVSSSEANERHLSGVSHKQQHPTVLVVAQYQASLCKRHTLRQECNTIGY